ncbi:Ribonuclease H [Quillaja saponaria]|uniref:Ribonuclease H n=1 Tax=Quillaja saponaria TaxID=32244 RepID=A0AAD7PYY4_QUISA|nr:Ribonuclease H [Quillaja saponaria]
MTNKARWIRDYSSSMSCELCGFLCEDCIHAMNDCPYALNVRSSLMPNDLSNGFFTADFEDWLHMNLNSSIVFSEADIPWPVMFSIVVWKIWKWRCKRIFDEEFSSPYNPNVLLTKYVKEI